jgi:hypothetical protein
LTCPSCSQSVEPAREELGLSTCYSCASAHPVPRYRGAMVYAHKTAGVLSLMAPDDFTRFKKLTNRRGQMSIIRNVLFGMGRAV